MSDDSGKPILVKATIHCPNCKKLRECKIDLKEDRSFNCIIICEVCEREWSVTFKPSSILKPIRDIYSWFPGPVGGPSDIGGPSNIGGPSDIGENPFSASLPPTKEPNPARPNEGRRNRK